MAEKRALDGLRVVDLSNMRTGAQVSQLLADFGADVVHVEPPGGSPLRQQAAWPFWARGKRSIQLDLRAPADLDVAKRLAETSDVVIETFRPGVADRLGIGYDTLAQANAGLIYASITGFGRTGPLADLQGYEGIVFARMGGCWGLDALVGREGPAFASAAYCSYPASQLALQGTLAALYERERSGLGQRVETSLAQALSVHDTFNFFSRVLATRYSDAFEQVPRIQKGVPSGGLSFRLLIALTADGKWLQFSQTVDRLFRAMMKMFELDWMLDDPEWQGAPDFDDVERRIAFWERLLEVVRSKTGAEWFAAFDEHPDVWGELFRKGSELLDHPQMTWNRMVAELRDPERGVVRQPGPLTHLRATPAQIDRPAPQRGEHDADIRAMASAAACTQQNAPPSTRPANPPLAGITVVELGTYYAAPYGATLLAELGARVIKLEQTDGDPHRNMLPFPEIAGIKALQGKECVAVELASAKGREIAYRIIAECDVVLQSFRAGVAERLNVDAASLHAINPDLVYLSAPGYGEGGPCGHRPAFAPTIGAGAGLAWRNAGGSIPDGPDLPLDVVKPAAMQLAAAVMGVGNSDGLSAVSVGTAMLLGLVARQRGAGGQAMLTTMLSSTAHALSEVMVEYEGRPDAPTADAGIHGFGALYRLYETAEEWVFLAAPTNREWQRLVDTLPDGRRLAEDARFASASARAAHDAELAEELGAIFMTRPARNWEQTLRAADVACVVAARGPVEAHYLDDDKIGRQCGFITSGHHPVLEEIPRLAPLVRFSRSPTVSGNAGLVGQDTRRVLTEFGFTDDELTALADEGTIVMA